MINANADRLCTWQDEANCRACSLRLLLGCRLNMREFHFFVVNQMPNLGMAVFGLVLVGIIVGTWWPLIAFGAAAIVMWILGLETRVLCSHCPYWAEDGKMLHCWALTGSPKIWRYRPGPMNGLERGFFLGFFLFLALFPPLAQGAAVWSMFSDQTRYGLDAALGMTGVTLATTLTLVQFIYTLRARYCSRCVNFSCPLNRVPRPLVDTYLARNRLMREAWEQSGYELAPSMGAPREEREPISVTDN